jgi:selenocysteine-specific elongation factor
MIVATAGHIDHGKSLLVKRLTGVDTDRLPEERARGISIDLGFAYLPTPDGGLIGFVDVPGHERFIRNMLAGVSGIDFALLIVAADDGIMPQTREHLQILSLLRVGRGAAVITKADRVDAARVQAVRRDVEQLLAQSSLAGAPVVTVSAPTGDGIAPLRDLLLREAGAGHSRDDEGRHFRFAVDRAFTVAGSGTVVTGTVFAGALETGDSVVISPSGEEARVRGLQIHGAQTRRVGAGQRCAINLARTKLGAVQRGDWILSPALHAPTTRIDVRLQVLSSEAQPLRHWTPVHVHLATCDVTARVAIRGGAAIAPGSEATVQLVLDQPIGALRGDRLIIRDQAAMRTMGGGMVLDPFASARRRPAPERARELAALGQDDAAAALAAWTAAGHAIDVDRFGVAYNLSAERLQALLEAGALTVLGRQARMAIPRARHAALGQAVLDALAQFHREQRDADGKTSDALRAALAPDLGPDTWSSLVLLLSEERKLEIRGDKLALAGHAAPDAEDPLWLRIRPVIEAAGYLAPSVEELAAQLNLKQAVVREALFKRMRQGDVMRVTPERFWLRGRLANLAAAAQAVAQAQPDGRFSAAQFRDATGVGRNHTIELLECFDRLGITRRLGDVRLIAKDPAPILGAGTPPPRPAPAPAVQPAAKTGARGTSRPPQRKGYGTRR